MTPELMRYRSEYGCTCVLIVQEGRKLLHAVQIDGQVRLRALPREERRQMVPLLHRGEPYPLKRAVRRFLQAGQSLGISARARTVLQSLKEPTP